MSFWSKIEKRIGEFLPDEVRDQLVGARKLLTQGRATDARAILDALVATHPEHPTVHALLGRTQLALGQQKAAKASLERALTLDEGDADALLGFGDWAAHEQRFEEAGGYYKRAIDAADGERSCLAAAYLGLGNAHLARDELDKAIRELRKAVAEAPTDPFARTRLGRALLRHPDMPPDEARRHLERATRAKPVPDEAWGLLGQAELASSNPERALECFAQANGVESLLGRGNACMQLGEFANATAAFDEAARTAPERADIAARQGEALLAADRPREALKAFEKALAIEDTPGPRERALTAALDAGDVAAAARLGREILVLVPDHSSALVAVATDLLGNGNRDGARSTLERALDGDEATAHVLAADLALCDGDLAAAVHHVTTALRRHPGLPRARTLLEKLRRRQYSQPTSDDPLARAQALLPILRALPDLDGDIARVEQTIADVDQALLVTVMGEFSSGKSSFVNAFIGADIAPVGVTPTTATINIAKYGLERLGRVRYRDGRIEELSWEEVGRFLADVSPEEAPAIEVVELLLPLPRLEQIHLVDTPGLNSMIPEHETVARGFMVRADAVVWLLTAGQAGKATERKALASLRAQGVGVMGVLNKVDQLSDEETRKVVEFVETELADYVDMVIPFSARKALSAQPGGDDGNLAVLEKALEDHFFRRSRELKRKAAHRRLDDAEARARDAVDARRRAVETVTAALGEVSRTMERHQHEFRNAATTERRRLVDGVADLYRRVAREVLELVRPRKTPFGSHKATRADRDYLLAVLESGFEQLLEPSRQRLTGELVTASRQGIAVLADLPRVFEEDLPREIADAIEAACELLEAQVFTRTLAYVSGYLRGGAVDTFFREDLARLELSEDAVYHALFRYAPELDLVLRGPLKAAADGALKMVLSRLAHFEGMAADRAFDLEVGVGRALAK